MIPNFMGLGEKMQKVPDSLHIPNGAKALCDWKHHKKWFLELI